MKGKTPYYVRGLGYRKYPVIPHWTPEQHAAGWTCGAHGNCPKCRVEQPEAELRHDMEQAHRIQAAFWPSWFASFGGFPSRAPKDWYPGRIY